MLNPYARTKQDWWQTLLKGPFKYLDILEMAGDSDEELLNALANNPQVSSSSLWKNLTDAERNSLLNNAQYWKEDNNWSNLGGLLGSRESFELDKFLSDLAQVSEASGAPVEPNPSDYTGEAALASRIAELTAPLDELRASRQNAYADELSGLNAQYNEARKGILSSQYRQNAQLADTVSSQMERSRRNALEAGASAGLRLADNINIMLSTQNKQAQTSLETSNQLAQMMLNQQAASRQARNDYDSYMMQDYSARNNARAQAFDEGYKQYQTAQSAYERDLSDWNTAYGDNPIADYYRSSKSRERAQGKYGGN